MGGYGKFFKIQLNRAFTLIELCIVILILSSLTLGFMTYLRKNNQNLSQDSAEKSLNTAMETARKLISEDIRQAVWLNPACGTNAPSSALSMAPDCTSDLKIRGGLMPYPGYTMTEMDALTANTPPADLTNGLFNADQESDALRILEFDFSGTINCRLSNRASNPSTDNSGANAERLYSMNECNVTMADGRQLIRRGGLYGIFQSFDPDPWVFTFNDWDTYSNVFQITDDPTAGSATDTLLYARSASGNMFNQVNGMGRSGFTNTALIYPVKIVDWAVQPSGGTQTAGLYRREIVPTSSNLAGTQVGYGDWTLIEPTVEAIRFYPITMSNSCVIDHERTLAIPAAQSSCPAVSYQNIRGMSFRMIVKSTKPSQDRADYSNPFSTSLITDAYPRLDRTHFVSTRNFAMQLQ